MIPLIDMSDITSLLSHLNHLAGSHSSGCSSLFFYGNLSGGSSFHSIIDPRLFEAGCWIYKSLQLLRKDFLGSFIVWKTVDRAIQDCGWWKNYRLATLLFLVKLTPSVLLLPGSEVGKQHWALFTLTVTTGDSASISAVRLRRTAGGHHLCPVPPSPPPPPASIMSGCFLLSLHIDWPTN